jgi:hypothetical protein
MEDIFNTDPVNNDVIADTLIGEGKKYKSADDLAKGYVNAETHIHELRRDLAALRAQKELEEANKQNPPQTPSEPPVIKTPTEDPVQAPKVSDEDWRTRFREEFASVTEEQKHRNNLEAVATEMKTLYGDKANERVLAKANELGVTAEYLKDMAARTPNGFRSIMGMGAGSTSTPGASSEYRPQVDAGGNKRNFAYYEELRKTSPSKYFSREVQQELFRQAKALGDAFYR